MKILIISDTHRHCRNLELVLEKIGPVDMLLHLGDVETQEDYIEALADCPCHMVAGNNDFFSDLPREKEIQIGKYRIFMTHGHEYRVSMTTSLLRDEAASRGCDIAMFGHTHKPVIRRADGLLLINPGSLSYPRQENGRGSYIVMELDREGEAHFTICYV